MFHRDPTAAAPTGVVRTFELVAAPTTLPLIDGKPLAVWAYNGQVPGPTLRITLGEAIRVHFTNNLPQETTIYWHGVRLPNAMDGVPYITQQPIASGASFTYEFTPEIRWDVLVSSARARERVEHERRT